MKAEKVGITPGPWVFDEDAEPFKDSLSGLPYLSVYATGFEIVRVHGNGRVNSRHDARLIAAAPQMYEALTISTDNLALAHDAGCNDETGLSIDLCSCPLAKNWRRNRAAIAAAEGE